MKPIETLRTYERDRFKVVLAAFPEYDHPADTIATGDPEADAEYVRKIESGEYPWFALGAAVYARSSIEGTFSTIERRPVWRKIGSSFLGWCDTYNLEALGVRDIVREAIQDARNLMEAVR